MTNLRSVNANAQRHALITQSGYRIRKGKLIHKDARVRNCTTASAWGEICQIEGYLKLFNRKIAVESELCRTKAQYLPRYDFTERHFVEI